MLNNTEIELLIDAATVGPMFNITKNKLRDAIKLALESAYTEGYVIGKAAALNHGAKYVEDLMLGSCGKGIAESFGNDLKESFQDKENDNASN